MSRATYTPIQPGDTRDVSSINDALTAFEAVADTDGVDGQNFREEGLDARPFEAGLHYRQPFVPIGVNSVGTQTPLAVWGPFVHGVVPISAGPITLVAGEVLEVRFRIQFPASAVTPGLPIALFPEFRIAYQITGGAFTPILTSVRGARAHTTNAEDGSLSILAFVVGPVAMDFIRVEVQETLGPAGTFNLGYPTFMGKIWRKVTPP